MARPKKYTKKTLSDGVERYFLSITRTVPVTEKRETGRLDSRGHMIYEQVPVVNNLGQEATVTEYIVPPTVGGLCAFLGIHRSTWAGYCDPAQHPEFSDTATRARGRMRAWREEQLLLRKDVKGIIFDLQNNYGYSERRQVELGENASKAVAAASVPMNERKALLEELAREFAGDGHIDAGVGNETAEDP